MNWYHASPTKDLTTLEPRISNHGVPMVYLSRKRENVLVYLSNAVEKYCKETGFEHVGKWWLRNTQMLKSNRITDIS